MSEKYEEGPLMKVGEAIGTFYGPDPSNEIARLREELADCRGGYTLLLDSMQGRIDRLQDERVALVEVANAAKELYALAPHDVDAMDAERRLIAALAKWGAK